MLVAGVDLGGRRARVCLIDPRYPTGAAFWGFEPEGKPSHVDAARRCAAWFRLTMERTLMVPTVLWFERPFGRFPEANFQLSLMAGAMLGVLPASCSVDFVSAAECRKLVGLSARSSKEEIGLWAANEAWHGTLDEHEADAYVVARAILAFGEREEVG